MLRNRSQPNTQAQNLPVQVAARATSASSAAPWAKLHEACDAATFLWYGRCLELCTSFASTSQWLRLIRISHGDVASAMPERRWRISLSRLAFTSGSQSTKREPPSSTAYSQHLALPYLRMHRSATHSCLDYDWLLSRQLELRSCKTCWLQAMPPV